MTPLSVIILVGREELHIQRCLERLRDLNPRQIFVVESQKGDKTHEIAAATAESLNWRIEEWRDGRGRVDRRTLAQKKIDEWLVDVDEATFCAALERLVEEKTAAGEYLFERPEDMSRAKCAAKSFFRDFSRRIVELSDGRCVYFAPDPRARMRNADNALSWAEYAFHAVSSGGDRIPGKNYNYRKYNEYKVANIDLIVDTLKSERCVPVLKSKPTQDAVKFFGSAHLGGLLDVVVRLDECGNANANLTEVTFEASSRRGQKKPPQLVSLTEAIRTVVSHQTATGTYPPNKIILANPGETRKGGADPAPLTTNYQRITTYLSLVWHEWPGNQAVQFNWALDNLPIEGDWILRLDADEYLTPELIAEIKSKLPGLSDDVNGVVLKRRHYFAGGWAKHGTYPVRILRLFRVGRGRYAAEMAMDEHLCVEGKVVEFNHDFVDHSLISMDAWREKHRGYAKREAAQAMESMRTGVWTDPRKSSYYKLPRYFRAFAYFCIRYFLKGGFLDGYAGWMWNFWQGLWYRWIVDREIGRR